jgi:hypothetical protein
MWGTCGSPVRPTGAGSHLTMAKYLFGSYLLDVDERRLLRGNEEIRLRGKLFDTLRVLVENAGKLVRKDAFMESVWPDSVVEDNSGREVPEPCIIFGRRAGARITLLFGSISCAEVRFIERKIGGDWTVVG